MFSISETWGYPFLLSLSFLFFGINYINAIGVSVILGSFLSILTFLICYLLLENEEMSLLSALIMNLLPLPLIWSGTAETNLTATFFILLTILSFLLFFKTKKKSLFLCSMTILAFTLQIRPDNFLVVPVVGLSFLLFDKGWKSRIKDIYTWLSFGLFFLFLLPHFSHMSSLGDDNLVFKCASGSDECIPAMSSKWFLRNWKEITFDIFLGNPQGLLLAIFMIIGMYPLLKKKKEFIFISIYSVVFYFFYLSLYAAPYMYSGYRHFLNIALAIAILAGSGIHWLLRDKNSIIKILAILLIVFLIFPRYASMKDDVYFLETEIPELMEKEVGECYVITEEPTVLMAATSIKSTQTRYAIENPSVVQGLLIKTCVYYFQDFFCVTPESSERCQKIHERYDLEEVTRYGAVGHVDFILYKVSGQQPFS